MKTAMIAFVLAIGAATILTPVAIGLFKPDVENSDAPVNQSGASAWCAKRYFGNDCPNYWTAMDRYESGLRAADPQGQFVAYEGKK